MQTAHSPQLETARPTGSTSWSGFAADIFSFPVMCMFLLAAVIFGFSAKQIAEPDIWWHLRDTALLFQNHTIPSVDTYAFTTTGLPRLDFEWLSEVPFFLAFKAGGLQGLLAAYFPVLVLIYVGVYYRSCRAGADCKDGTLVTLMAIFLGVVSIGPRTLLFGWLCMMGLLLLLDRFQRTGKGLWLMPPLFALWINLHGSWVFGVIVLVLTIASGLVEGEWGLVVARRWSSTELKKLLLVLTTSLAALFANPFGYKLVLYPFDLLFRQQGAVRAVAEWRPADFSTGDGQLALIMILALVAGALFSRRRWKLDEVLLTAFALWAALSHTRFLFFAGLIIVPILAPRLELFPPYERELDKPWLNAFIIAAIVGALIFFFPSEKKLQQKVDDEYPATAVQFMQQHQFKGRVFNEYVWGGYLEWNAPELKPIIDGRADVFVYKGVFDDFVKASAIKDSLNILDKYQIDYALLNPAQALTYLLEHSAAWRTVYSDKVAVVFERVPATPVAAQSPLAGQ